MDKETYPRKSSVRQSHEVNEDCLRTMARPYQHGAKFHSVFLVSEPEVMIQSVPVVEQGWGGGGVEIK
jgi:hypothetical protein